MQNNLHSLLDGKYLSTLYKADPYHFDLYVCSSCHIKNMALKLSDTRWAFSSCNNFA
ncbi:conserved hypothetical protein (plasmid) [Borreliella burgdorferi 64b]|nr:conserved hypothetical protein [Borreliella burgdorferi 64b]